MRSAKLLLIGLAACGGGDDDSGAGDDVSSVRCGAVDTVEIDSTVDGVTNAVSANPTGFAWVNIGKPSKFDGQWSGGGSMHLEWASTVANGSITSVTAATLVIDGNTKPGTFQSGSLVYESSRGSSDSTLKTTLTFANGRASICIHKK
jgi:hypothetical protein